MGGGEQGEAADTPALPSCLIQRGMPTQAFLFHKEMPRQGREAELLEPATHPGLSQASAVGMSEAMGPVGSQVACRGMWPSRWLVLSSSSGL